MIQGIGQDTFDDMTLPHVNCWEVNIPLSSGWTITELRRSNDSFTYLMSLVFRGPNGETGTSCYDLGKCRILYRIQGVELASDEENTQLFSTIMKTMGSLPSFSLVFNW